ncbi:MAG TPA: nucleotidyltransferase domain-containing protein [Firmicutes bacterium]|nr:nucleotidyltransferase domain-containing protein [Candidatus Fermentithermobacillaceae bacterium]
MERLTPSRESTLRGVFDTLLSRLFDETVSVYGADLTSLVVFGSVGRGTPTPSSDIDLLLIARTLPSGRMSRVRQFEHAERALEPDLAQAKAQGVSTRLSPVFRTESEMALGGLLFLDMVSDSRILFDRGSFFATYLRELEAKLTQMGSIRVKRGGAWHWVLKPDLKAGEVFEI